MAIMTDTFTTGSYVVFLSLNDKPSGDSSIPTNYCYQLRDDSNSTNFRVVIDVKGGVRNGFTGSRNTHRLATEAEIQEYKRRGKPYDVRELSPEQQIINNYLIY